MNPDILQKLIQFRRDIHRRPQLGLQQFQTNQKIKQLLIQFGVGEEHIRSVNPSGLIVDIKGQGQPEGHDFCLALRADTDALEITENNPDLEYKSQIKGRAHACGHDGHAACLLALVPNLVPLLPSIPRNKTIRLLFQPGQQTLEGAKLLVEAGCMEGVNEVYGFHNINHYPFGILGCKQGAIMAIPIELKITIAGNSGHASVPQKLKIAAARSVVFYYQFMQYVAELQKTEDFVCVLPVFQTGERLNVVSEVAKIQGTIRCFSYQIRDKIVSKIQQMLSVIESEGFKTDLTFSSGILTANTPTQAQHIMRLGRKFFGEDKVTSKHLPVKGSEDFGHYVLQAPGAFFFVAGGQPHNQTLVHSSEFNFNDNLIDVMGKFWLVIVKDRLEK